MLNFSSRDRFSPVFSDRSFSATLRFAAFVKHTLQKKEKKNNHLTSEFLFKNIIAKFLTSDNETQITLWTVNICLFTYDIL